MIPITVPTVEEFSFPSMSLSSWDGDYIAWVTDPTAIS